MPVNDEHTHINMLFLSISPNWAAAWCTPPWSLWGCGPRINVMLRYVDCIGKDTVNPIKFNVDISISVFQLHINFFPAPIFIRSFFSIYLFRPYGRLSATDVYSHCRTPILSAPNEIAELCRKCVGAITSQTTHLILGHCWTDCGNRSVEKKVKQSLTSVYG